MKYDFETRVDRTGQGSIKWEEMYEKNPNVADEVVPLSVADMELKHPPQLIEGLKKHLDKAILGYTGSTDSYKESVKNWMKKRHNFDIKKEWIVNTAGVVPAFFNAIREFSQKGDGVIIMSPVYYPFYNAIKFQKRNITDCPLKKDDNNYYTIDYELFDKLAGKDENKILLFCSPHNPVGRVWSKDELKKLGDLVRKHDLLLLSDEIHFDLMMGESSHTVFQTVDEDLSQRTITFTAPSKSFNIAGMGMSNIIIKNQKIRKKFIKGLNRISAAPTTAVGYKACQIVYDECEDWLDECIKLIDKNQDIIHEFFKENYPKIKAPLMEGTYLMWVDFRDLGLDPEKLEEFMTQKCEIFLDEGYIFGENGKGFERFNLAAPSKVIEETLQRLDKGLKEIGYK